jgi:hypothetical protein
METFGSPVLADVAFNDDGTLKNSGKQNVKFYNKKRLAFKAKRDESGTLIIDPKTGIPAKEAFEEVVEFIRVETKGDTNIIDDVATDFHKRQFYRQYKFFREGKIPDGNPIEDFDFLQPSTVMELHMLGIHVLQQAAEMTELECDQLKDQSGYEVRDLAAQWIRINSPQGQASKASKLELENAKLRRELEDARASKGARFSSPVAEMAIEEVSEPIATMEVSPESLNRKRKV